MTGPSRNPRQNPSGCADLTAYEAVENVSRGKALVNVVRFDTPIPPSVNHAFVNRRTGGRVLSSESNAWLRGAKRMAETARRKYGWKMRTDDKLIMELWAYWPDARRRDIHNLHKLIADAFEGVLYRDDRYLLIRDMDFTVDRKDPRVEIEVRDYQ